MPESWHARLHESIFLPNKMDSAGFVVRSGSWDPLRLFRIASEPGTSIFINFDKATRQDVRQVGNRPGGKRALRATRTVLAVSAQSESFKSLQ